MPQNYSSSQVGVPYVRAHKITIYYPELGQGMPWATIDQSEAVKLLDGTVVRTPRQLPFIQRSFNLVAQGNDPIPLVNPETGEPILNNGQPMTTSLNQVMLGILAVVRREQIAATEVQTTQVPDTPLPPQEP